MTSPVGAVTEASLDLPRAALELARVFAAGGRLIVTSATRSDHARHVAVEFVHPAITGARSLPSMVVEPSEVDATILATDALLVIEPASHLFADPGPACALVLTAGADVGGPELVRWYHVLWELVQLGLEHPGLTGGSSSSGGDSTNFLYPFLDAVEVDEPALLASMSESVSAKETESADLCHAAVADNSQVIDAVASVIRECNANAGTVFAIGNGGSSCDAARLVRLLRESAVRATSLAADPAVLTALANDLGVVNIFARQVEAAMRPGDVLVAFSTSGSSVNLMAALDIEVARSATIVACAGYGGGPLAAHANVDHAMIVDSTSVHRIQEAQGAIIDEIRQRVMSEVTV